MVNMDQVVQEQQEVPNRLQRDAAAFFIIFLQLAAVGIANKYSWGFNYESFGMAFIVASLAACALMLIL